MKYNKYLNKIENINNLQYHFNSYNQVIKERYNMMLNLLSNMINLKRANDEKYSQIKNKLIPLTNDHYVKYKLIVGATSPIITLLNETSVINITLTDDNTCYIQTICGYNIELLDILIQICREFGLSKIETFSNYQPEHDFLLQNRFIQNKNKYLEYVL
jgi:hypothetical protein